MQTTNQHQKEQAQTFLNNNLRNHFHKQEYSIEGMPTSKDVYGCTYQTYRISDYDNIFMDLFKMEHHLSSFIKTIKAIVDGLILAKSHEAPEGSKTMVRNVEVHWRMYPEIYFEDRFGTSPSARITFRISTHHKPLEEDQA